MLNIPRNSMHVAPQYQPIFREVGLDAETVFTHPDIKPWRTLPDRENCVLDVSQPDGSTIRFHVKRLAAPRIFPTPADVEVRGLRALEIEGIPTAPLVGYGRLQDGRSFVITEDLAGYEAADKLIAGGFPFDRLLAPTADLAAKLHRAGLHHRDLYLCHFLVKTAKDTLDLRLIDAARVARLGGFLNRQRWIVKDLAQFWYSTMSLPITAIARQQWLARYGQQRSLKSTTRLQRSIERKSAWIAQHDAELRKNQPNRNISIPAKTP